MTMENLSDQMTGETTGQEIKNTYNVGPEMKEIFKKLETLEVINHAFWLMLSQKGYTNEEFDSAIDQVLQLGKKASDLKLVGAEICADYYGL